MQCPRCGTNIMGNINKCPACGTILNSNEISNKNQPIISNGLLDQRDLQNYTKNIELYKKKNKEPNILLPILIILSIVTGIFIIAIFKLMS